MNKEIATPDYHVHCGQYYNTYYQPADIIQCLYDNGIESAWISSTTSCIDWDNQEEKEYIIQHIEDEIAEAVSVSTVLGVDITPLYWVIPKRHFDGDTVEEVVKGSPYKGFKIHPRSAGWSENTIAVQELFEEVCVCAEKYAMPILIHTGVDVVDAPDRFENFFLKYSSVKFVLAHCKDARKMIDLFSRYKNVYGDTAFCPSESYNEICKYGFGNRMQSGTDFPISHWIENEESNLSVDVTELSLSYKKLKHASIKL